MEDRITPLMDNTMEGGTTPLIDDTMEGVISLLMTSTTVEGDTDLLGIGKIIREGVTHAVCHQ